MALVDEVQSRYSTQYLVNVSNPQNSAATTIDTTRLANAATDVQALFKIHAGVAYDNTVDTHVATAVAAVVEILKVYTGQADREETWPKIVSAITDLGKITGRDRIVPGTDSQLSPTEDRVGDKPVFDRAEFDNYTPGPPTATSPLD